MLKILELLNKSRVVNTYEVQDFRQGIDFYYIKIRASLHNNTILYIRQYVSDEEYSYSYHWQDESGLLIVRWDNAPHHKQVHTYPHHKHLGGKILASNEMTLEDVLKYIDTFLEARHSGRAPLCSPDPGGGVNGRAGSLLSAPGGLWRWDLLFARCWR